uniref:Bifunctional inhibitor/plant lipid transfer protein/seed storage helical domain-containing protein n=1 Tax=Leersia perrieri TaxID=77586 RepID=A0A0D9V6T3_9ORYZ
MARLFAVCLVLLSFAMAAAAARPATSSSTTSGDCGSDVQDLMANCQDYVKFPADPKINPSQACCDAVQRANMPCVCNKVTPEVEQLICMDKVVYVVAFCMKPFQPGSHCGSYHSSDNCANDLKELIAECRQYVMNPADPKVDPSDTCCSVVQKVDIPCLCSKVTKEIEKIVSMEKVIYVASYCKRPFQPGSKCGSYTIPPV